MGHIFSKRARACTPKLRIDRYVGKAVGTFPPLTSTSSSCPWVKMTNGVGTWLWVPILPNSSTFKFYWCGTFQWQSHPSLGMSLFHLLFTPPVLRLWALIAYGSTRSSFPTHYIQMDFLPLSISFLELLKAVKNIWQDPIKDPIYLNNKMISKLLRANK